MAFDGSEGGAISLSKAGGWTANYRRKNQDGIKAHYIGRDILEDILNQSGCMGIRVYYAIDDEGNNQLIFVGASADENDMTEGVIADFSFPCPARCASQNPLNS